jgi:hypothetical protein
MIEKLSKRQLEARIRTVSMESARVVFTKHALRQMRKRAITRAMSLEILQHGQLRRTPEPNVAKGTLECRMDRFMAGRDLGVIVALSDDDPDLVVVTAMELG